MPRKPPQQGSAPQTVEEHLTAHMAAVQTKNIQSRLSITGHLVQALEPVEAADRLLSLAGRYRAEGLALKSSLEEKNELLRSLLAEARRIDQVLGLIREPSDDGDTVVWAVLKGPPHQAARFHPAVDPKEVCPDDPEEPVWVWLVHSQGGHDTLVVAGKIDPPSLLQAGVEKEMVFRGFVESGDNEDGQ